jgi:DNA-binding NarL/FixJ family response regulator
LAYNVFVGEGSNLTTESSGPILVVDDDDDFRSFLAELLESVGYRIAQARDGSSVLAAVLAERPAVVILDVQLPRLSGYEICRQLRDRFGDDIPILLVSGERTEPLDRAAGLIIGGSDYMTKPVDTNELVARVRRLGGAPSSNGAASTNGKLASLTRREREVLSLLTEGLRQEEIAQTLVISPTTVATHIQRILRKLEVRSRAQAVAVGLGSNGSRGATPPSVPVPGKIEE